MNGTSPTVSVLGRYMLFVNLYIFTGANFLIHPLLCLGSIVINFENRQ